MSTAVQEPPRSKADKAGAAHRDVLRTFELQEQVARIERLEKLARKDPEIRRILDENATLKKRVAELEASAGKAK